MANSMTGFGRGEYLDEKRDIVVEIKSINHRYNDVIVKISRKYSYFEDKIRNFLKSKVNRGRVEVYVGIENLLKDDIEVELNNALAGKYHSALIQLKENFGLEDQISADMLSKFPDVLKVKPKEENEEELWLGIKAAMEKSIELLNRMRKEEGQKLIEDIVMRCDLIKAYVLEIEAQSELVVKEYKERLTERIRELLDENVAMDEMRLSMEVAIFADKSNITEELVRLDSHIAQLKKIFDTSDEPVGRKLDFLIQEMNRETNTIGSKTNSLLITNKVVEIKSELEKIREQIQNIE